jgi:DNA-binding response OmpR family regulator
MSVPSSPQGAQLGPAVAALSAGPAAGGSRPRPDSAPRAEPIRLANLEIRPAEFEVLADRKRVGLTVREFQTFLVLAQRPDRVVTRPEIYSLVWGGQMTYRDRSVDVFVRKVRRKLQACSPSWVYIHTHFGVGYRFSPERVTSLG